MLKKPGIRQVRQKFKFHGDAQTREPPIVHHINRLSAPQGLLKGPSFDHLRLLVVPWGRVTKPVFRYMQQTCPNLRCHSHEWLTLTLILTSFPFSDATLTVYMKMPRTSHRLTFTVQLMPLDCHIRRYITAVLVLLVDYLYIYSYQVSVCLLPINSAPLQSKYTYDKHYESAWPRERFGT